MLLIAGVFEVNQFIRKSLIKDFFRNKLICYLLFWNFDNGYGLYRYIRKAIMSIYILIAAFPKLKHIYFTNI